MWPPATETWHHAHSHRKPCLPASREKIGGVLSSGGVSKAREARTVLVCLNLPTSGEGETIGLPGGPLGVSTHTVGISLKINNE
jgi:hypothetical protein